MLALQVYRREFRPSTQLEKPYAMVGVNVIAADTDAEARRLFTSAQQAFTNAVRGTRRQLAPPIDDIESYWSPAEKAHVSNMLACSFVGSPQTIHTREIHPTNRRRRIDGRIRNLRSFPGCGRMKFSRGLSNSGAELPVL